MHIVNVSIKKSIGCSATVSFSVQTVSDLYSQTVQVSFKYTANKLPTSVPSFKAYEIENVDFDVSNSNFAGDLWIDNTNARYVLDICNKVENDNEFNIMAGILNSAAPSKHSADRPSRRPSSTPTGPSSNPTANSIVIPSMPTTPPTLNPTTSLPNPKAPTSFPTTTTPSSRPTSFPTISSKLPATPSPLSNPTATLSYYPTATPSYNPTGNPSYHPPSNKPTATPSYHPTAIPSYNPTGCGSPNSCPTSSSPMEGGSSSNDNN
eukprot:gene8065-10926_t